MKKEGWGAFLPLIFLDPQHWKWLNTICNKTKEELLRPNEFNRWLEGVGNTAPFRLNLSPGDRISFFFFFFLFFFPFFLQMHLSIYILFSHGSLRLFCSPGWLWVWSDWKKKKFGNKPCTPLVKGLRDFLLKHHEMCFLEKSRKV